METPASYVTRAETVGATLDSLRHGDVVELGRSAGGRPLAAVRYGEFEAIERRANHSAAWSADEPEAFFGRRQRRVIVIVAAVHGAEMESIAGVMNLISVLERGRDLAGVEWPVIGAAAARLRVVIVPIANPDGRARIAADDPLQWSERDTEIYRHGADLDGEPVSWIPGCFVPHPQVPSERSLLGGYFNDAGVNPSHGAFLGRDISPEAHLLAELAEAETADAYLDLHSCSAGPFFLRGFGFAPAEVAARQAYVDGAWRVRMRQRGLPTPDSVGRPSSRRAMGLAGVVYHRAGSLPLCFEGGSGARYHGQDVHRQIVDAYMTVFETVLEIGVHEGFRPRL